MVHWAHPSPGRKWQLDRFSRFCMADRVTEKPTDHATYIYVVLVSHLKTGIQERINIIISFNQKNI